MWSDMTTNKEQDRPAFGLRPWKYLGAFTHSADIWWELGDYHYDSSTGRMYFFTENWRKYTTVA